MTAWEIVERYRQEYAALPLEGTEAVELHAFANRLGEVAPENDALLSVVQMLRQREREDVLRMAGQMVLL